MTSHRIRAAVATAVTATALFAIVPAANAGVLVASAPDCAEETLTQPFAPWLDLAGYQFAPDGGFEADGEGWDLDGSNVVSGNESYDVHGADDSASLRLGFGDSATSPTVCVGIEHPTIRLFAKRAGLFGGAAVSVLFEDAAGNVEGAPIGVIAGTGSWQPTLPMPVVANLLALLPGEHTPVRFHFTALGGGVQIDDLYVDPYRRN